MKIVAVLPHFAPDVAPTGTIWTRIVEELAERGHHIDVVTALPWYRTHQIESGYEGRLVRREDTPWGSITRVHPFPVADKTNILRRALGFGGFSTLAATVGLRGHRSDIVVAISPPLTLGLTGAAIARARRARFVFNIQDVFPDVAIELGHLSNPSVISAARWLERRCYALADAVTVLSEDLHENVAAKVADAGKVHTIPNFVDSETIRPGDRNNGYRREFGLGDKIVVMYAGNVGMSQSLDALIDAASALAHDDRIAFVINGQGAQRSSLERRAQGLANVTFVDMQPLDRLPEVLAAADLHVIPLKKGLASSSFPSKLYSILASGRPVVASVDEGSDIATVVERSGAGVAVAPDDPESLTKAIDRLTREPAELQRMGESGRRFIENHASPAAIAARYEELFESLLV
ncbi:MAG TPA: glycosyltransferase family 4 protein [Actinomycetota bacterium]|nr:glycosyltransferase family 4 protein [Actinomycetota bacterium]